VLHQGAFDDPRKQSDIDVATSDDHGDGFSIEASLLAEQRGDTDRSSALRENLLALEQAQNRRSGFFFVHRDDIVDVFIDKFERKLARFADRDSVGYGRGSTQEDGLVRGAGRLHRRKRFCLYTDDANTWPAFLDRACDTRDHASSADRDDHRIEIRSL